MSVGLAGRLGLPETVPWSTCHNDRRADLLNDGSGLEEQCSHHRGKTAWPFMTQPWKSHADTFCHTLLVRGVTSPPRFKERKFVFKIQDLPSHTVWKIIQRFWQRYFAPRLEHNPFRIAGFGMLSLRKRNQWLLFRKLVKNSRETAQWYYPDSIDRLGV